MTTFLTKNSSGGSTGFLQSITRAESWNKSIGECLGDTGVNRSLDLHNFFSKKGATMRDFNEHNIFTSNLFLHTDVNNICSYAHTWSPALVAMSSQKSGCGIRWTAAIQSTLPSLSFGRTSRFSQRVTTGVAVPTNPKVMAARPMEGTRRVPEVWKYRKAFIVKDLLFNERQRII